MSVAEFEDFSLVCDLEVIKVLLYLAQRQEAECLQVQHPGEHVRSVLDRLDSRLLDDLANLTVRFLVFHIGELESLSVKEARFDKAECCIAYNEQRYVV